MRDKDSLLREKAILLQEVQHRVANSLQIIASVLLQSARKVQSEEAKGHLVNAHQRLMSVAALQSVVAEIFAISRFEKVLTVCASVDDALAPGSAQALAAWRAAPATGSGQAAP